MINPLWLKTFTTLVEQKHFTRAATVLHMTQPGVSQHIRKLEEYYQVALINRSEKSFELTPAGEKVLQFAHELISTEEQLKESLQEDNPYEGVCRLSSPGALAMRLYPQLCTLQQEYRKLLVQFEVAPNHRIISALLSNAIDIGLITNQIDEPELVTRPVDQERLLLVVPTDYRQASYHDLCQLGTIMHPDASHHVSSVLRANYPQFQHLSEISVKGSINQINLILEPVAAGSGFTVLPESIVKAFHRQKDIHILKTTYDVYETIYLTHKRHRLVASRYKVILRRLFPFSPATKDNFFSKQGSDN